MIKKFLIVNVIIFSLSVPGLAKPIFIGKPDQKPLEVAISFLHDVLPSGDAEGKELLTIHQSRIFCKGQEVCPLQSKIILTTSGLNDDSIMKQRRILILQQNANQSWEIIKQDITQVCQKGRGHSNYSKAICQ